MSVLLLNPHRSWQHQDQLLTSKVPRRQCEGASEPCCSDCTSHKLAWHSSLALHALLAMYQTTGCMPGLRLLRLLQLSAVGRASELVKLHVL